MSISAIILAAGKSIRMGQPKMLMPWGNTTVLGKVIETLQPAGVEDITRLSQAAHKMMCDKSYAITSYQRYTINDVASEMLNPFNSVCRRKNHQRRQLSFVSATSPRWRKEACGRSAMHSVKTNPALSCQVIKCGADIRG